MHTHLARPLLVLAFALLAAGFPESVLAQTQTPAAPQRISYQGYLVDKDGTPLGDTIPKNYDAIFRIYTASSGGTAIWSEQQTITLDKGYFSVLLGEGGPVGAEPHPGLATNVFNTGSSSDRYIGVTVKGLPTTAGIEIAPRLQLLTSPYAMVATYSRNSDNAGALVNTDGATVVTIQSTPGINRVGIHQANPEYPLDVVGDIRSSGTIRAASFAGSLAGATFPPEFVRTTAANTFNADQTIKGTLNADRIIGQGSVPVGGIILWSGIDRTLDGSAWALCDGTAVTLRLEDGTSMTVNTPDLRDRFVMGSRGLYATNVTTSSIKDIRQNGGQARVILTTKNMPTHSHTFRDYYWLNRQTFFDNQGSYIAGKYEVIPNAAGTYKGEGESDNRNADRAAYIEHSTASSGEATPVAVETTPPYYKLAYIMRCK